MKSVDILKKLVQIKSLSKNEGNLAQYIFDFGKENNLDVERQDGNIIYKFQKGCSKCIILNAHMDTVKPGDINLWQYPPFGENAGVVENGKLYGLGASDDKAGIASYLKLALLLKSKKNTIDVFIVFVINEEIDGSGSNSFVSYFTRNYKHHYKEVSAIIAEPTNLKTMEIGHRGNYFIKLVTNGDSGHGSQPQLIKIHAIDEMTKVITIMKKTAVELAVKYKDNILGIPTFSLTGIYSSETSPNKIPPICSSTWDIRTTPKLHNKILKILSKKLRDTAAIELIATPVSYGLTSPNEDVISVIKNFVPSVDVRISPGSNDICFFTQAGIPAVTFGPGNKETIHKENEFVDIENIDKAVEVYKKIISSFINI